MSVFFAKRLESIADIKTMILINFDEDGEVLHHSHDKPHAEGSHIALYNNTGLDFNKFLSDFKHNKKINYVDLDNRKFEVIKEFDLKDFRGEVIGNYLFFFSERSILHSWFGKHMIIIFILASVGTLVLIFMIRNGFIKSIAELEINHSKAVSELVLTNASLEDRVHEELELNRQKDQIINQQKQVADMGEMLSAVSHHWRQPINAIGLYVQDLIEAYRSGELDEEYIKDFEKK